MSEKPIYNIVFNEGIDGIVSASYYLSKYVNPIDNYRLFPISSFSKGDKFDSIINGIRLKDKDRLVILDYDYHKESTFWVDHHFSQKIGYEPVSNDKMIYNPSSKSSFDLLVSGSFDNDDMIAEIIKQVNMIDKSEYPNIDYIFHSEDPLMILRAYIEKSFNADMMFCRIVELISSNKFYLDDVLIKLKLDKRIISDLNKSVNKIKKEILIFGSCSLIRQSRIGKNPRYAEFYLFPKVRYGIRFSRLSQDRIYFQIGYNKWTNHANDVNIGQMITSINYLIKGGGTYNTGGGVVSEEDSDKLLDDLSINLNHEGNYMFEDDNGIEKYAVDPEDSTEKKAQEILKTAKNNDISKAREEAVKSSDKEKI